MSPEIETEIREGADNVELNITYEIINVENVTTDVSFYKGIRVELLSAKAKDGSVMLWQRPITTAASKMGAFITLLGSNTDKWLHKWVFFRGWEKNKRVIELITAPVAKVAQPEVKK